MPKVEVWQCPHTDKMFPLEKKREYQNHLKKLSRERMISKKWLLNQNELHEWVDQQVANVTTLAEMKQCIMKHSDFVLRRHYIDERFPAGLKLLDITMDVKYNTAASNSHSAPRSGVKNWHRKPELAKGYAGFTGRVWFVYSCNHPGFLSSVWGDIGLHTGSGGYDGETHPEYGKCYKLSYSVNIYLDDWPGIKQSVHTQFAEYEKERMMAKIAGTRFPEFNPVV